MMKDFEDFFPNGVKTEEDCIAAIKNSVFALEFVPDELKTERVCQEAINNISAIGGDEIEILYLIPYPDLIYKNLDMLSNSFDPEEILLRLNPDVIDDRIIDWGIEKDGRCIRFAPKERQTEERLERAIDNSGLHIFGYTNVKKDILAKPGIIEKGIIHDSMSFRYIQKKLISPENCLLQDKLYPYFFDNRPDLLPERVKQGVNVYTLSKTLEELTKKAYSFEEIINLYNGKRITKDREIFIFNPKTQQITQMVMQPQIDNPPKKKFKM